MSLTVNLVTCMSSDAIDVQHCQRTSFSTVKFLKHSTVCLNIRWEEMVKHGMSLCVLPSSLFFPGTDGQTRDIPYCPHSIPTVHPVPVYHGSGWTDTGHPILSALHPHCPSRPSVPWERMDRHGTSHSVHTPSRPSVPWERMDRHGTSHTVRTPSPLSIPSQCAMGTDGQTRDIPFCPTWPHSIPTVHPVPVYHGNGWTDTGHPIVSTLHPVPVYHGNGWTDMERPIVSTLHPHCPSCPSVPWERMDRHGMSPSVLPGHTPSPLSIPSQCTMGTDGQTRDVPFCPTRPHSIPTVHPVPVYHGNGWTDTGCPLLSYLATLHPYCPSRPSVPWERMDRHGTSPSVLPGHTPSRPSVPWERMDRHGMSPSVLPGHTPSPLSIPSQYTMGTDGQTRDIPFCPTRPHFTPTVHPVPVYHGNGWTDTGRPIVATLQTRDVPFCPTRPHSRLHLEKGGKTIFWG